MNVRSKTVVWPHGSIPFVLRIERRQYGVGVNQLQGSAQVRH